MPGAGARDGVPITGGRLGIRVQRVANLVFDILVGPSGVLGRRRIFQAGFGGVNGVAFRGLIQLPVVQLAGFLRWGRQAEVKQIAVAGSGGVPAVFFVREFPGGAGRPGGLYGHIWRPRDGLVKVENRPLRLAGAAQRYFWGF